MMIVVVSVFILALLTVFVLSLCVWETKRHKRERSRRTRTQSVLSNDSTQALAIPQIKRYNQPLVENPNVHNTSEDDDIDNGRTDGLVTPYTAHSDTPTQAQNGRTKRKETNPQELDNPNRNSHPPLNGTPKSLIAQMLLTNIKGTESSPVASKAPPTSKQTKYIKLPREESPTRDFNPSQNQNSKLRVTAPLPKFQRLPVETNPRPKSHFNPSQHQYEFANGCQTLPSHYPSAKAPMLPPTQLKKTTKKNTKKETPISHHYEVADNMGTTPSKTAHNKTPISHHYEVADNMGTTPSKAVQNKTSVSHHYEVADDMGATPPEYATPITRPKPRLNQEGLFREPARDRSSLYAQLDQIRVEHFERESIKVGELIGSGQFGRVHKGEWFSLSGATPLSVAIKILNLNSGEEQRVKFLQEAAIMGQFRHPNIVNLMGVVTVGTPEMIVLELLPKGDLRKNLLLLATSSKKKEDYNLPTTLLGYCQQIASGMTYLSNKAFIHRDLAARNILVSEEGMCKVADFGMARNLLEHDYYISHGGEIPVKWTAPEALHYKKFSTASDVWSFGCVMYEIWSLGHKPFDSVTNIQAVHEIQRGNRLPPPPGCPRALYQLMISCWHPEAAQRPGFEGLTTSLSQNPQVLLKWSVKDKATNLSITKLGADIALGRNLYQDLQTLYK